MKVKDLLETTGSKIIPEYAMLRKELADACWRTNNKFGILRLDENNFAAESMYYGADNAEYFVMYVLTNDEHPLDISSLYSGDDKVSSALKKRLESKPKPASEWDMMIDCLQHEIIPMLKKHGATEVCASKSSHYDIDPLAEPFEKIDAFSAKKTFEERADEIKHVFFYLHVFFPEGIKS